MPIYKDKNNTWYVKYKNKTKRGFKTKREAKIYLIEMELAFKENQRNIIDTSSNNQRNNLKLSYFYVANEYLNNCFNGEMTYGSYIKIKTVLNNIIFPNIENKNIFLMNEKDCKNFYKYLLGLNYSTKYKNFILGTYRAVFNYAVNYYDLNHDPSHLLKRFKKTHQERIKEINREQDIWTVNEFEQFIGFVDREVYKNLFIAIYYTGMRLGEALSLTWNDFYDGQFFINESLTRKTDKGTYEIKAPKSLSSIRHITLGDTLSKYFEKYKTKEKKIPGFSEDWFIFGRLKPLSQSQIYRVMDKAIAESHVKSIRIHALRHSHASNLIANNVNIVAVSKRLGHSSIDMTLRVYTHLLKKNEDELVNSLEESFINAKIIKN